MNENETPILVCATIANMPTPHVPSVPVECMECRQPLWRSIGSLSASEIVDTICAQCAATAHEIEAAEMLPSVRAELLAQGWTLAETEQADRDAAAIVRALGRRVSER